MKRKDGSISERARRPSLPLRSLLSKYHIDTENIFFGSFSLGGEITLGGSKKSPARVFLSPISRDKRVGALLIV